MSGLFNQTCINKKKTLPYIYIYVYIYIYAVYILHIANNTLGKSMGPIILFPSSYG